MLLPEYFKPLGGFMVLKCSSCNREVFDDYIRFKCPACGKAEIIRCDKCRGMSVKYVCPECGFEGP